MLSRLAAALFLVAGPVTGSDDTRAAALTRYFEAVSGSPLDAAASGEFIAAADRYHLDWRLLPALAAVETAAGKAARGNNLFGWGRRRFDSVRDAIWHVAQQLAEAPSYRGKSTREKLVVFNRLHARRFPARVEKVMREIGPAPPAATAIH